MFSNIAFGKIKTEKCQIWQQNTENHKHLFALLMSKQIEKPLEAESYRTFFSPNTENFMPLSHITFFPIIHTEIQIGKGCFKHILVLTVSFYVVNQA